MKERATLSQASTGLPEAPAPENYMQDPAMATPPPMHYSKELPARHQRGSICSPNLNGSCLLGTRALGALSELEGKVAHWPLLWAGGVHLTPQQGWAVDCQPVEQPKDPQKTPQTPSCPEEGLGRTGVACGFASQGSLIADLQKILTKMLGLEGKTIAGE